MDFSIVIVTWNAKAIVRECLRSLAAIEGAEVIVVDNASSDGTSQLVRHEFPGVTLIQNDDNLGFARANNMGITACSPTSTYICLINSDVIVPPGCVEKMAAHMNRHPDVGLLGPRMRLPDGHVGASCSRFPSLWNWFCRALALDRLPWPRWLWGDYLMFHFDYQATTDVDVLFGWFWMIRREALDKVGLLDERFFMYGEDIEWSKRFHLNGWRVVYFADAEATHHCRASSALAPTRFYVEKYRANLQYCHKYHARVTAIGYWALMCLHEAARFAGYGALALVRPSARHSARHKIERSAACLLWLFGLAGAQGGATQAHADAHDARA